jgi:hypothetical protein
MAKVSLGLLGPSFFSSIGVVAWNGDDIMKDMKLKKVS